MISKGQSLAHRLIDLLRQHYLLLTFSDSSSYWRKRYGLGGSSGRGSIGEQAQFKAEVLNRFVRDHSIARVIEFGCGDGRQLALAEYPIYLGLDVSGAAVRACRKRFGNDPTKAFLELHPSEAGRLHHFLDAPLTLSLDVIYHLVEDEVYEEYLVDLFLSSRRFVVVFSTDHEQSTGLAHIRHRHFASFVARQLTQFRLASVLESPDGRPDSAKFHVFERVQSRELGAVADGGYDSSGEGGR